MFDGFKLKKKFFLFNKFTLRTLERIQCKVYSLKYYIADVAFNRYNRKII